MNRVPIEIGEWYHCYSRGVDKRKVFQFPRDFERFLALLFVSNADRPVQLSNVTYSTLESLFKHKLVLEQRKEPIVEIGAYCLMPNHVHVIAKEIREGGLSLFMQKVFTGYTMYFNKKNERTGALFSGTFKSKHVDEDEYLQHAVRYVHMNPIELVEPRWKEGRGKVSEIEKFLSKYPYSSFRSFEDSTRIERRILGSEIFDIYDNAAPRKMLEEAQEYYQLSFSSL